MSHTVGIGVPFECESCGKEFLTDQALWGHEATCTAGREVDDAE